MLLNIRFPGEVQMKSNSNERHLRLVKLVQIALITAIVVVLQLIGAVIHFGPFSVSLVLVPIVIGAILYGPLAGAWLGFVFGLTVLLSGDAAPFYAISAAGTIILVLLKGTLAGFVSGIVYKLFGGRHKYLAVFISSALCPIVNTGVFLIGCLTIFRDSLSKFNGDAAVDNPLLFVITAFIGLNFVFELALNIILAPAILRLTEMGRKRFSSEK